MNIDSAKSEILENLKDREYREAFMEEGVYTLLAFQIRSLREQRAWSQKKLGRMSNMAQERVSILEDPNADTKPMLSTLLRLAAAFDIGLDVRFVPFSKVLDGSFNNTPIALQVASFEDELSQEEELRHGKFWLKPERIFAVPVEASTIRQKDPSVGGTTKIGCVTKSGRLKPRSERRFKQHASRKPPTRSVSNAA